MTRDLNIRRNPAERRAVRDNEAKLIALSGKDARNTWAQLELFMRQWRAIEASHAETGPFIKLATRSTLVTLDLGD